MTADSQRGQLWLALAVLVISGAVAFLAATYPIRMIEMASHLIGVLSVLVGVSLAVAAVLASPLSFSEMAQVGTAEQRRIERVVKEDDAVFAEGLLFYFYTTLLALVLLLCVLLFEGSGQQLLGHWMSKILFGVAGFLSATSILLSFRLPVLLVRSARLRSW